MKRRFFVTLAVLVAFTGLTQAGVSIGFDQNEYTVQPGGTLEVKILLDANDGQAGAQALQDGLFSMGIKLTFESDKANVANIAAIVLPDEINGNGVGGPAYKEVGTGFARAAGAVSLSAVDYYHDTLLATITITDLNAGAYPYTLNLETYYGASMTDFMDGNGTDLDSVVSFGSATVVPEPTTLGLLVLGGVALIRKRKIMR